MPFVVLSAHPDLAPDPEASRSRFDRALAILQGRQDADGAFARWYAGGDVHPFVSAYASHFLMESRARGHAVPQALLERALSWLEASLAERDGTVHELRARAYALYLVTKNGAVRTKEANALAEDLRRLGDDARGDLASLLLASVLKQLRLDAEAERLAGGFSLTAPVAQNYAYYYDALVHRAFGLYLLANHFPERAKRTGPKEIEALLREVEADRFNTLSASLTLLALDAHARLSPPASAAGVALAELAPPAEPRALAAEGTLRLRAPLSTSAQAARATAPRGTPLYAQLVEAGYDRSPPADAVAKGVEVLRELRRASGEPAAQAALNEKLDVVLRVRAIDGGSHELAIVDLLPGGFEVDIGAGELAERRSIEGGIAAWNPDYVDVREDRVVFYGWVDGRAQEFAYRIVPTNRGRYAVPPIHAEGLYERGIEARSSGGALEVTGP
jgi:uncharacterized protein YfaS (alpha-2-macroglobulin family)